MNKSHHHVIEQVPVDYYQRGINNNFFQRYWHKNKLNKVLNLIDFKPESILDVGCASGWFLFQLSKEFPSARCYGIDIYDKGIKYAKKIYPKIEFEVADAHKLPYQKTTFDLVVCTEVLEHLDDPKLAILEIKRVLKKGGFGIIELDSGNLLFSVVWYIWRKLWGRVWNDSHLHSFNIEMLEKMILSCGLDILRKKRFNLGMAMVFLIQKKQ